MENQSLTYTLDELNNLIPELKETHKNKEAMQRDVLSFSDQIVADCKKREIKDIKEHEDYNLYLLKHQEMNEINDKYNYLIDNFAHQKGMQIAVGTSYSNGIFVFEKIKEGEPHCIPSESVTKIISISTQ